LAEAAAAVVLSGVCAVASVPTDAAATESGVAVGAVPPFAFAAPFAAVPLVLALVIAGSMVLTRCRVVPDPALALVPALPGALTLGVVEPPVFAACVAVPVPLGMPSVPVAEPELEFPPDVAVPSAGAAVGCAEVSGVEVCGAEVGCVGAAVLASSQAAKGVSSFSWLGVDGCNRAGEVSETAAAMSDTILGILGTGELPGATLAIVCLQPPGHCATRCKTSKINCLC
jgi:hypothetical protein